VLLGRVKVKGLVEALGWSHPGGFLTWGTLKAFADGSLGSRTAKMQEPYADVPSTCVTFPLLLSVSTLAQCRVRGATQCGLNAQAAACVALFPAVDRGAATSYRGIWVTNMTKLREDIIAADANGMQVRCP
jgi:predicted amidohydrolase YtcJ